MRPLKTLLALSTFALAAPCAIHAQGSHDPSLGTWALNVAKSQSDPGPGPKSATWTYVQTPSGIQRITHEVTGTGALLDMTITFKRDGKPYPFVGNPNVDAIAFNRVSPLKCRSVMMRGGKIVGHGTEIVSKDGKTLTIDGKYTFVAGKIVHNMMVFDRQ